jgi:hypothetical protein
VAFDLDKLGRVGHGDIHQALSCGFTGMTVRPLRGTITIPGDDIPGQHLLTARRQ